jgi:hypothetical protein
MEEREEAKIRISTDFHFAASQKIVTSADT